MFPPRPKPQARGFKQHAADRAAKIDPNVRNPAAPSIHHKLQGLIAARQQQAQKQPHPEASGNSSREQQIETYAQHEKLGKMSAFADQMLRDRQRFSRACRRPVLYGMHHRAAGLIGCLRILQRLPPNKRHAASGQKQRQKKPPAGSWISLFRFPPEDKPVQQHAEQRARKIDPDVPNRAAPTFDEQLNGFIAHRGEQGAEQRLCKGCCRHAARSKRAQHCKFGEMRAFPYQGPIQPGEEGDLSKPFEHKVTALGGFRTAVQGVPEDKPDPQHRQDGIRPGELLSGGAVMHLHRHRNCNIRFCRSVYSGHLWGPIH